MKDKDKTKLCLCVKLSSKRKHAYKDGNESEEKLKKLKKIKDCFYNSRTNDKILARLHRKEKISR